MVLCVKVPIKKAQRVKEFINHDDLLDNTHSFHKDKTHIFFPITKKGSIKKEFPFVEYADRNLRQNKGLKTSFKESAGKLLSKDEQEYLKRAFDITGDIAIMEIPPELRKKEKLLANLLLDTQKNVNTVLKKAGIHTTEFRTQKMSWLAGKRTKETVHTELGIRLKLNVETVYFSPRLSTERKRIAEQVRPGEVILVMFSGCAPYCVVFSKKTKAKEIVGVEINPEGHRYGEQNLLLNKTKNVKLYCGDVRKVVPKLKKRFDRIVMPLPKTAGDFLDVALAHTKQGATINFYAFEEKGNFDAAKQRIKDECKKAKRNCRILRTVKCGQHGPGKFRICVDFKVI